MSEVLREFFEFAHSLSRVLTGAGVQAMLDMIVNQLLLGLRQGCLDGMKLLRQIEARLAALNHGDDFAKMTFRAFETENDAGVRAMHWKARILSPRIGQTLILRVRRARGSYAFSVPQMIGLSG